MARKKGIESLGGIYADDTPTSRYCVDGRTLQDMINYIGQEREARKLLIAEGLATVEEVAGMCQLDVCSRLAEEYAVVAHEDECITLVRKDDLGKYLPIVKYLNR